MRQKLLQFSGPYMCKSWGSTKKLCTPPNLALLGWTGCIIIEIWYKQWKVRSGCLGKFALGNSQGQIFQTTTEDFPLFFRLLDCDINHCYIFSSMDSRISAGFSWSLQCNTLGQCWNQFLGFTFIWSAQHACPVFFELPMMLYIASQVMHLHLRTIYQNSPINSISVFNIYL